MTDYVSKEELKEFFEGITITVAGRTRAEAVRDVLKAVYNGVMELPTTDAVPVRHGHWNKMNDVVDDEECNGYKCSNCGEWMDYKSHFCPYCGARMDGNLLKDDTNE